MNSYVLIVGDTEYRLRYTNQSVAELEKRLDKSLLDIMSDIGDKAFSEPIAQLLFSALKPLQPQLKFNDVYVVMDEYIDEGHVITDLIMEITEALKVSGFFKEPPKTADKAQANPPETIEDE